MQRAVTCTISLLVLPVVLAGREPRPSQTHLWQADLQIRTLEVMKTKSNMSVRIVIYTERDDEARNAHVLVLLPLGVGIERLGVGCVASPGPSNVPALRGHVLCALGAIPNRGFRELALTTTLPMEGLSTRFAVFAYSATPDPVPANNYAERTVP